MLVFIQPAMIAGVAILASFVQFVARFFRLAAVATVILNGFMKTMVSLGDTPLATVLIGSQTRRAAEEQESRQRRTG
jgi:hypothetical protein